MTLVGARASTYGFRLFTRRGLVTGCGIMLAVEIAMFSFIAAGTYGRIVPLAKPVTTDFVSFYAAGKLADAGLPQFAYDRAAHYSAEQQATEPGIPYNFFYYPPVFLLLCDAFARLPYIAAFVAFEAVTLAFYLLVARRILDGGSRADLVLMLSFPPVFWTIGIGQNAFLTAALFGAATLYVDRKPVIAGLFFGALCYKPHFALLVPVALMAAGYWRSLAATFASALALSLLSLLAFGWPTWYAFLVAAAASPAVYESGQVALGGFVTPFGAVLLLGGSPAVAYGVQAAATALAAVAVAVVWRRARALPDRAAVLAAATLVAIPLAIVYDLMLASIAGLWLLHDGGGTRLPEWGKWGLAVLFVLSLSPRTLAEHWHLPVGAFISISFFVLAVAVALRGRPLLPSLVAPRGPGEPIGVRTIG
jgi:Glycosyltransferase family 87